MVTRFDDATRHAVVVAQREAKQLGNPFIGPEHLFLGLTDAENSDAAELLRAHRTDVRNVRERLARTIGRGPDGHALASIGIDLNAVRSAVEKRFGIGSFDGILSIGPGHLPLTRRAKKALGLSRRYAQRLGDDRVRPGHLLIGTIECGGLVNQTLASVGIDIRSLSLELVEDLQVRPRCP